MNDAPTTRKFVAVLNRKIEPGKLMNALAHMSAGLGSNAENKEAMRFESYFDKDGGKHPNISDNPFIILTADNSNQIRTLRKSLIENSIPFTDFTSTMTVGTFAEQRQKTRETAELDLEYFGICFFGEKDLLSQLTKKFSLWR